MNSKGIVISTLIKILVVLATLAVLLVLSYAWYKQGGSMLDYLFGFFE